MLETWSEGKVSPHSVQASLLRPGTLDLAGIAWESYGGKVGVWRIINLLNKTEFAERSLSTTLALSFFPKPWPRS